MSDNNETKIFRPAIRSGMGIWNYYVSTLTYRQIAEFIKMPDEIYQSEQLSKMLQRALTDNTKSIYQYLKKEDERLFNSLVLAVYGGTPKWHEGVFEMNGIEFSNIGVLELSKAVNIFPVDGQHRVAAIKELVENGEADEREEVPVIYIAHIDNEEGIKRTRRLFTTLNRYAKPVKLNEIIALDEDDVVAIVTRRLVEDNSLLGGERISVGKNEAIGSKDKTSFTTIITLYKCNDMLLKCFLKELQISISSTEYKRYRPSDETIELFFDFLKTFWTEMINHFSELKSYMSNSADASAYRTEKGGNLLFRPAGLKAFVGAMVMIRLSDGSDFEYIFEKMSKMDLSLEKNPWKNVLWNNGKMIMNNNTLVKACLLTYYDIDWKDGKGKKIDREKMLADYAALIGREDATEEELLNLITQK